MTKRQAKKIADEEELPRKIRGAVEECFAMPDLYEVLIDDLVAAVMPDLYEVLIDDLVAAVLKAIRSSGRDRPR